MKKILAIVLSLAMIISLAACSGSSAQTTAAPAETKAAETTAAPEQTTEAPATEEAPTEDPAVAAWPEKPIQILVPANAGGGMSITASYFLNAFAERTGQTPVMTNNAGLPGYTASMELEPDGYNYFLGNSTIMVYKSLGTLDFGYEAYDAVGILGVAPAFGVWVLADSGMETLDDLVNAMKEKPGEIIFGNKTGTFNHLYEVLLLDKLGTTANLIDFGDDAACVAALLGKNSNVYVGSYSGAIKQYCDDGTVICLAVADEERVDSTPDVPTFKECGYDFVFPYQMTTLVAPKGTDPAILDKLNAMLVEISNTDQYKADMEELGSMPCPWDRDTVTAYFEECQKKIDEAASLLTVE